MAASRATQVFQYPDDVFIENISILPDGQLLLATFASGDLHILDPNASDRQPRTVLELPINSLAALAPIGDMLYAVSGGEHVSFGFVKGTMKVFIVSLRRTLQRDGTWHVEGTLVDTIPVPDTKMLNGMASVPANPHIILSNDSIGGRLFRLDTRSREAGFVSADACFGIAGNEAVPLGANGIRIKDSHVYLTNSAQGTFGRMPIDDEGIPTGGFEVISQLPGPITSTSTFDDFTFDMDGNAYVTYHPSSVYKVNPDGERQLFAGGPLFHDPTSAVLANDGRSIYVCTAGVFRGTPTSGGQIIQVEL